VLRPPIVAALVACLLVAGCGRGGSRSGGGSRVTTKTVTQTVPNANASVGCKAVAAPRPKGTQNIPPPTLTLDRRRTYTVVLQTNCGEIDIRLDVARAPRTTASVAYLVKRRFYDGLTFHRIGKDANGNDFVIQGGDPLGDGSGGPGYSIRERPPSNLAYTRDVVAMAKTEIEPPGSSGSQFFIVTAQDAQLPADYALLGRVVKGDDVVSRIAAVPTSQGERPTSPIVISKATLVQR
jgi:peptidyl-prolyl cis-trans isomerase B (cyclophilin B)